MGTMEATVIPTDAAVDHGSFEQELTEIREKFLRVSVRVDNTASAYRRALVIFFEWMRSDRHRHPFDLTIEDAVEWVDYLRANYAQASGALYCQAVSRFYTVILQFDVARTDGKPLRNWFALIKKIPVPKRPRVTQMIPEEQLVTIMHTAKESSPRNSLILRLMYEVGLRREEVAALPKDSLMDDGFGGWKLRVTGKGNKQREIGIKRELADELREWFSTNDSQWAFPGQDPADHLCVRMVNKMVSRISGGGVHPHQFRHTHATHSLEQGCPLVEVTREMGHADAKTTLRYLDDRAAVKNSPSRVLHTPYQEEL
jgi:site-specific recombinase XerD